jgi:AcrR family transcriptional regulator
MVRMSAEQRRECVVRAAIAEFARKGYHGTSTQSIARRVGVSQPYLFRLFPDKKAIFIAAALRCMTDTRLALEEAAARLDGEAALRAMADAYTQLITEHPERLQMQLQTYTTAATLDAEGDHRFGEAVRADWMKLWDFVHLAPGAEANRTKLFLAHSILINVLATMSCSPEHPAWEGLHLLTRLAHRRQKTIDQHISSSLPPRT